MAVPQNKKSSSRTRMRRNRAFLPTPSLCLERGGKGPHKAVAALRRRHHIGADGIYRGVQYFIPETDIVEED